MRRRRGWDVLGIAWTLYWTWRMAYEDHDNRGEDDWRDRPPPRKALPPGPQVEPWADVGLEPCRCPRGHTKAWVRYSDWAVFCTVPSCDLFYSAEWADTAAYIASLPEKEAA